MPFSRRLVLPRSHTVAFSCYSCATVASAIYPGGATLPPRVIEILEIESNESINKLVINLLIIHSLSR